MIQIQVHAISLLTLGRHQCMGTGGDTQLDFCLAYKLVFGGCPPLARRAGGTAPMFVVGACLIWSRSIPSPGSPRCDLAHAMRYEIWNQRFIPSTTVVSGPDLVNRAGSRHGPLRRVMQVQGVHLEATRTHGWKQREKLRRSVRQNSRWCPREKAQFWPEEALSKRVIS